MFNLDARFYAKCKSFQGCCSKPFLHRNENNPRPQGRTGKGTEECNVIRESSVPKCSAMGN